MRVHGVDIGAVEQRLVGGRIVGADAFDQVGYCRIICGLRGGALAARRLPARGQVFSASSGAQVGACFCIRGKSVRGASV